jgi:branched-chain amino acid transport system permease protein
MAGSILGGLTSIYGALIGGFVMGLTEVLVTSVLVEIAGSSIIAYKLLIPLAVMVIVLMKEPNGISGLIERLQASASRYG